MYQPKSQKLLILWRNTAVPCLLMYSPKHLHRNTNSFSAYSLSTPPNPLICLLTSVVPPCVSLSPRAFIPPMSHILCEVFPILPLPKPLLAYSSPTSNIEEYSLPFIFPPRRPCRPDGIIFVNNIVIDYSKFLN